MALDMRAAAIDYPNHVTMTMQSTRFRADGDGSMTIQMIVHHPLNSGWQPDDTTANEPLRISTMEAARRAGVSPSTIRRWVKRGYLDAIRTRTAYLVDADGLDAARETARARRGGTATNDRIESAQNADFHDDRVVSELPSVTWGTTASHQPPAMKEPPVQSMASTLPPQDVSTGTFPGDMEFRRRVARVADRNRVLEGLQRGIILEQAKYQRAVRRKDREAIHACVCRLDELHYRLRETEAGPQHAGTRADTSPSLGERLRARRSQPGVVALMSAAAVAKDAPSRRMFNVAALLILNGVLMMMMNLIA
jgi:excisionase family DNA binding protein